MMITFPDGATYATLYCGSAAGPVGPFPMPRTSTRVRSTEAGNHVGRTIGTVGNAERTMAHAAASG
jgi:hypothetical protein